VEDREVAPQAPQQDERDYEPPELVEPGSFEDLTQGGGTNHADGLETTSG
jgi:hypothetical protein